MAKYRTKPFEIEAIQYDGNLIVAINFVGDEGIDFFIPAVEEYSFEVYDYIHDTWVKGRKGDYIVKGMKGEFYPCDPEVFEAKYEEVQNG